MIQKVENVLLRTYLKAKLELMKLEQEEDGMETLETVILIGIAAVVAVLIINFLTGKDGQEGIISKIFTEFEDKLGDILGDD